MSNQLDINTKVADPVLQFDDMRLRQISAPVPEAEFDGAWLRDWVGRLDYSRIKFGGIGIAAPQVGLFLRLVALAIPAHERVGFGQVAEMPLHALVNPQIVWYSEDKRRAAEGCLSVKGYEGFVVRPGKIGVVAYSPEGKQLEFEADSLYARALQHEIDHLDGILYPDRITALRDLRKVSPVAPDDPVLNFNKLIPRSETGIVL
ncbi:peptide deformylase [Candidatus Chlorohelix sp.]|uniref:peptide deformylase n=1 Tax=Candidatus Chlorohelix sp. TaxID=3139201 RepID=UPI003052D50B